MSKCSELIIKGGGAFSYDCFCNVTGAKIGDENNKTKVDNLCYCDCHYDCPIYKSK